MITLQPSDIVRLRGSNIPMTIEKITGNVAVCVWFDTYDKLQRIGFRLDALELVDPPKEPKPSIINRITFGLPTIIFGGRSREEERRDRWRRHHRGRRGR